MKTKELSILLTSKKEVKSINKALKKYFPEIEEFDIDMTTNYHKKQIKENGASILKISFTKEMSDLSVSTVYDVCDSIGVETAIAKLALLNVKKEKRCQD